MKTKVIAMLLAGGQGTRLKNLTYELAKPAIPFGGKYRIIDFPLSNCTNSDIHTVGVLTQYQPHLLHQYIGLGTPWDLDKHNGGVTMLPPYAEKEGVRWYSGTANAIYQNMNYMETFDPEYVLVLSGDHIYKMNYELILDFHIEKEAAATISVIEVPWEETHRFGIMNTDEQLRVVEFDEKPKEAKSNLASMGVYVFSYDKLKEYLLLENENAESSHDFGKDIIPLMLDKGENLMAYPYKGYWKDVGTVESFWESNMDLLNPDSGLNLHDPAWRIYSSNPQRPPQMITSTGNIQGSFASEGCIIGGTVNRSVIFQNVHVKEGAEVEECVVMSDVTIGKNVKLKKVVVPMNVTVPDGYEMHEREDDIVLLSQEMVNEWKGSGV